MWSLQLASILSAFFVNLSHGFVTKSPKVAFHRTVLSIHQFNNGGYDASRVKSVQWSPMQASEFVVWHVGESQEAGMQIAPMIKHWSGTDAGEFLTRLFLGEVNKDEYKISYCPSNVRNPQWQGLGEKGLQSLATLLMAAFSNDILAPSEIARCAESFLLKDHRWPVEMKNSKNKKSDEKKSSSKESEFESDTFATAGHSANIARVLGSIRKERVGEFSAQDVIAMLVTLPENDDKHPAFLQLTDFFSNVGIELTKAEKIKIVEGMAAGGWAPANIARFVGSVKVVEREATISSTNNMKSQTDASTSSPVPANDPGEPVPEDITAQLSSMQSSMQTDLNGVPKPDASNPWKSAYPWMMSVFIF